MPDEGDVIIWHLPDRDGLDAYRVTKGPAVIGEFTGRSIGQTVFQTAAQHTEPDRAVWLKDDRRSVGSMRYRPHSGMPSPLTDDQHR